MRHLALALAAVLSLALVAPAFAQPFADVPADHWAFDAIAELAAKGIIEGYPDGTFKGDRAMTRYEMAMVVARILARIEAIKIPPPPKIPTPDITLAIHRADIDRLTRLINEFRAELSALGVRITAVEEQVAALTARLDNTFITGETALAYVMLVNTAVVDPSGGSKAVGRAGQFDRFRTRLTFRGQVAPDFQLVLRARYEAGDSVITGAETTASFDRVYVQWASPWGLTFRVGQNDWRLGGGTQNLLLDTGGWQFGASVTGTFGGIALTALSFYNTAGDVTKLTYGARAQTGFAGWTFGVNYRQDRDSTGVVATTSGWSGDAMGVLIPGVSVEAQYASTSPCVPGDCAAWFAQVSFELASLGMAQYSPVLNVYYKNYGANFDQTCGGTGCNNGSGQLHQGAWLGGDDELVRSAWGVDLTLQLTPKFSFQGAYESGTAQTADVTGFAVDDTYSAWTVQGTYTLSRNARVALQYYNLRNNTTSTSGLGTSGYAAYLTFTW